MYISLHASKAMKTARGICVRGRCRPTGFASKVSARALGQDLINTIHAHE